LEAEAAKIIAPDAVEAERPQLEDEVDQAVLELSNDVDTAWLLLSDADKCSMWIFRSHR
jgi:hypothetical protein